MHEEIGPEPQLDPRASSSAANDEPADLSATPAFLVGSGDPPWVPVSEAQAYRQTRSDRREPRGSTIHDGRVADGADIAAIPMATISPRRLLQVVATVVLAWGVISFGRQVATASAATTHADELRAANGALQLEVAAMERELTLIQEHRYVNQRARAYRLGGVNEIPFALQTGAGPLPADAPGSASVRLGASAADGGPLESWLNLLFGPG